MYPQTLTQAATAIHASSHVDASRTATSSSSKPSSSSEVTPSLPASILQSAPHARVVAAHQGRPRTAAAAPKLQQQMIVTQSVSMVDHLNEQAAKKAPVFEAFYKRTHDGSVSGTVDHWARVTRAQSLLSPTCHRTSLKLRFRWRSGSSNSLFFPL